MKKQNEAKSETKDKKYRIELTTEEIIILNTALDCAHKPIEYIGKGETLKSLKERFSRWLAKVFEIEAARIPKL